MRCMLSVFLFLLLHPVSDHKADFMTGMQSEHLEVIVVALTILLVRGESYSCGSYKSLTIHLVRGRVIVVEVTRL